MSPATKLNGAIPRPDKSPEAIARRREIMRQAAHNNAMEGVTAVDPEIDWVEKAFIEGDMTTAQVRTALLAHFSVK